jgi:hypothetical protein
MTSRITDSQAKQLRRVAVKQELDRQTWATNSVAYLAYDTIGAGETVTEFLDFGTVFERPPFFSYGVELKPGYELVDNDFPFVTAGVAEWNRTESADSAESLFYLGARVWIRVVSTTRYGLRFRFAFEGTTIRNVQYFRGSG